MEVIYIYYKEFWAQHSTHSYVVPGGQLYELLSGAGQQTALHSVVGHIVAKVECQGVDGNQSHLFAFIRIFYELS